MVPIIKPSDTISAEAVGYISYQLSEIKFEDPLGLNNAYIAKNGSLRVPYGKSDNNYLLGTLRPSVILWHYAGHNYGVNPEYLENYQTFCVGNCIQWEGYLVMIRKDRYSDLSPVFSDWQKVVIDSEQGLQLVNDF